MLLQQRKPAVFWAASTTAEKRCTNILAVDSQFHHFSKDNTAEVCIAVPLPRELCNAAPKAAIARSAHAAKKLQKGGRGSGSPSSKEQRWELEIVLHSYQAGLA